MRTRWLASMGPAAMFAVVALGPSTPAGASHLAEHPRKHRIVYQLDDAGVDKARFVLGNIQNHIAGVGKEHIEAIELVVFGPALRTFVKGDIDPGVKQALERLRAQGVGLGVCGNTMRAFNLSLEQLPDGARPLPQGGVVRLMELQEQGYINIRP